MQLRSPRRFTPATHRFLRGPFRLVEERRPADPGLCASQPTLGGITSRGAGWTDFAFVRRATAGTAGATARSAAVERGGCDIGTGASRRSRPDSPAGNTGHRSAGCVGVSPDSLR